MKHPLMINQKRFTITYEQGEQVKWQSRIEKQNSSKILKKKKEIGKAFKMVMLIHIVKLSCCKVDMQAHLCNTVHGVGELAKWLSPSLSVL